MSPWDWRALAVVLVLAFVASVLAASRLHRSPRVERQILAAAALGGIPAVWIFTIAWLLPGGGHVVGLAFGCGVGAILGTAGAWAVRERSDGRRRPALAFVGTLVGAALGSAVGAAIVFAVYVSDRQLPGELMLALAAAYVGSFAALGFEIGAG
jgi:tetrahydromethanopterin S-methyltransferase subunit D